MKSEVEDCDMAVEEEEEVAADDNDTDGSEYHVEEMNGDGGCTCETCGKSFTQSSYLARHRSTHTMPLLCSLCGRRFCRVETLRRHKCTGKQNASVEKPKRAKFTTATSPTAVKHRCHYCAAVFDNASELLVHAALHSRQRLHDCTQCGRVFARRESLLQHMARKHREVLDRGEVTAYPCKNCYRVFATSRSLRSHQHVHSGGATTCASCHHTFVSQLTLSRHNCPGEVGVFSCPKCEQLFANQNSLLRHIETHNNNKSNSLMHAPSSSSSSLECPTCGTWHETEKQMTVHAVSCKFQVQLAENGFVACDKCDETFTSFAMYTSHCRLHKPIFGCVSCGRQFLRQANLDSHRCTATGNNNGDSLVAVAATSESAVACSVCGRRFRGSSWLQRHMKVHRCEHCGVQFTDISSLSTHVCSEAIVASQKLVKTLDARALKRTAQVTPGMKVKMEITGDQLSHVCPICGRTLSTLGNLNKHIQTHGEKREVCNICGKRFHLKIGLREHERYVHADPGTYAGECTVCGKRMRSRNSLYNHMAQFHPSPSEVPRRFTCQTCGRDFAQRGNLRKHELTHSSALRYPCCFADCERSFRFPEQLRRHELWHSQGAAYACPECDRSFVLPHELRRHVAIRHGDGGALYRCSFCGVCCRHQQTMRRHLYRRHIDVVEMHQTTHDLRDLIQSLLVREPAPAATANTSTQGITVGRPPLRCIARVKPTQPNTSTLVCSTVAEVDSDVVATSGGDQVSNEVEMYESVATNWDLPPGIVLHELVIGE